MFQNLALFPVPTAQKREGQKGQRVLSRTQPLRSTTSETTFIVQTLAKYSNVKSYRQGFHENYKKEGFTEIHLCDSNQSLIFPDFAT